MAKIYIEYQDQFGKWHQYQTKHNERDAFRVASARAKQTGKRHRIVDENRRLLDMWTDSDGFVGYVRQIHFKKCF